MTNKSNSLFLGMWRRVTFITSTGPKELMVTLAWALGLRQSAATAALERTILKEVLSTAKAAAANKVAISSAPPTASTTRLVVMFLLTFSNLSSSEVCWSLRLIRRSLAPMLERPLDEADCVSPSAPPFPVLGLPTATGRQYMGCRSWTHPLDRISPRGIMHELLRTPFVRSSQNLPSRHSGE